MGDWGREPPALSIIEPPLQGIVIRRSFGSVTVSESLYPGHSRLCVSGAAITGHASATGDGTGPNIRSA